MSRPSNYSQLAHENYMLKIKYNELLHHFIDLKKELAECRETSPDSIRVLQSQKAEINRKLVQNPPKHAYYAEDSP